MVSLLLHLYSGVEGKKMFEIGISCTNRVIPRNLIGRTNLNTHAGEGLRITHCPLPGGRGQCPLYSAPRRARNTKPGRVDRTA